MATQHNNAVSGSQPGFIQLIDRDTQLVLAQRKASNEKAAFDYLAANVWHVNEGLIMRFVEHSDYAQPRKFFHLLPKTEVVKVYHNQLTNSEPADVTPYWQGGIEQIDENSDVFECEQWDAFDSAGNWVGTSEY
ncbi:hypothetical protein ACPV5U_28240 [Vibrio mediterranei]